MGEIHRLDAERFAPAEPVAGNAAEPIHAHQLAAVLVAAHLVFVAVSRRGFHIGARIGGGEQWGEALGIRFAKVRHARGEIRPHGAIATKHFVQS